MLVGGLDLVETRTQAGVVLCDGVWLLIGLAMVDAGLSIFATDIN